MTIIVKLNNKNTAADSVKLYRSTSRIDTADLPEPIATLPGDAKEYVEKDFLQYDTDYYYVVEVTGPHGNTFSPNRKYRLGVDVGPGPKELIAGNEEFGLFGVFSGWDYEREIMDMFSPFFTPAQLMSSRFVKFIRKGKICYIRNDLAYSGNSRSTVNAGFHAFSSNDIVIRNDDAYKQRVDAAGGVVRRAGNYNYIARFATIGDSEKLLDLNTTNFNWTETAVGVSELLDILRVVADSRMRITRDKRPFRVAGLTAGSSITLVAPDCYQASYCAGMTLSSTNSISVSATQANNNTTSTYNWLPIIEYRGVAIDNPEVLEPEVVTPPEGEPDPVPEA